MLLFTSYPSYHWTNYWSSGTFKIITNHKWILIIQQLLLIIIIIIICIIIAVRNKEKEEFQIQYIAYYCNTMSGDRNWRALPLLSCHGTSPDKMRSEEAAGSRLPAEYLTSVCLVKQTSASLSPTSPVSLNHPALHLFSFIFSLASTLNFS